MFHIFNKTTLTAATCTTKGTSKYTCACGYSHTSQEALDSSNHTFYDANEYSSNIKDYYSGSTFYRYCVDCGEKVSFTISPGLYNTCAFTINGTATSLNFYNTGANAGFIPLPNGELDGVITTDSMQNLIELLEEYNKWPAVIVHVNLLSCHVGSKSGYTFAQYLQKYYSADVEYWGSVNFY